MAAFRYRAMDAAGKPQGGMIEAASAATARQSLRAQGLLPLAITASSPVRGSPATRKTGPRLSGPALWRRARGTSRASLGFACRGPRCRW